MLTCYGHNVRLPQSDLAYVAFRLALLNTLADIECFALTLKKKWASRWDC